MPPSGGIVAAAHALGWWPGGEAPRPQPGPAWAPRNCWSIVGFQKKKVKPPRWGPLVLGLPPRPGCQAGKGQVWEGLGRGQVGPLPHHRFKQTLSVGPSWPTSRKRHLSWCRKALQRRCGQSRVLQVPAKPGQRCGGGAHQTRGPGRLGAGGSSGLRAPRPHGPTGSSSQGLPRLRGQSRPLRAWARGEWAAGAGLGFLSARSADQPRLPTPAPA